MRRPALPPGVASVDALVGGREVILSYSGGKDSNACALLLRRLGVPFRAVYCDTGWEAEDTYRYIRNDAPGWVGPIEWVRAVVDLAPDVEALARVFESRIGVEYSPMVRLVLKWGMFPSGATKWCTRELKVKPFTAWLAEQECEPLLVMGIRAQESRRRAAMGAYMEDPHYDCGRWHPLIDWAESDVIAEHQSAGVKPNPLYLDENVERVGCWPCIQSNKGQIKAIVNRDPGRIDIIRDLEAFVSDAATARAEAKGAPPVSAAWFRSKGAGVDGPVAIDAVAEWARTLHGGRQMDLLGGGSGGAGCMRWGMCEAPKP